MAEGDPPHSDLHPMRVIFKIPQAPPPTLQDAAEYSEHFNDFIKRCLEKDAAKRPTAAELMQHPFIVNAQPKRILMDVIDNAVKHFTEHGHMVCISRLP